MIVCKVVSANMETAVKTFWEVGVEKEIHPIFVAKKLPLCTIGWFHSYRNATMAELLHEYHLQNYKYPLRVFSARASGEINTGEYCKVGSTKLVLLEELGRIEEPKKIASGEDTSLSVHARNASFLRIIRLIAEASLLKSAEDAYKENGAPMSPYLYSLKQSLLFGKQSARYSPNVLRETMSPREIKHLSTYCEITTIGMRFGLSREDLIEAFEIAFKHGVDIDETLAAGERVGLIKESPLKKEFKRACFLAEENIVAPYRVAEEK